MKLETIKLDKALNQAYFKQSLKRADIDLFKTNFKRLFERINEAESEEHNKNIVSDFLKNTFYKDKYEINTAGRKDLAIHKGNTGQTPVSVIIEAKSPANKTEMISLDRPNTKALHETIHYFLHERLILKNNEIKHLIITNIYDWFIFDAADFEKHFYANKTFQNQYKEWINKELPGTKTDWFYNEIAKPFIDTELESLQCVHINLMDYAEIVKNSDQTDDSKLINLYKTLSPEHLLKLPFANDYNKINTGFYNELLHILGLEETKEGGKKLITRVNEKDRLPGTILENTINIFESRKSLIDLGIYKTDKFNNLDDFSVALELTITWLNRILFLKLLEAQLVKYHNGDKSFLFLNTEMVKDFDELDELFFDVFAIPQQKRLKSVVKKFGNLPYLNSSLFDTTYLEQKYTFISGLKNRLTLEISKQTVLKDQAGNRRTGELNTLEYLFAFLDAYSFAGDSKAEIQETERTIINAAVLGLIFEKINGYKDGSFYTPSFITMYMSRETLRRAVAQKFNELENKQIETFDDVKNYCARYFKKEDILRFNSHINSLKIVDPAVGSGHFLVSALNELVAIKSELNILSDTEGKPLEYEVMVNNDELTVLHKHTNEPFEYVLGTDNQPPKQLQTAQVALFHEKQTIIENCLFGVDINPKSVLICRLRLWIELLKNAYYVPVDTRPGVYLHELQTLPNIDINIKIGNSLISRFGIDTKNSSLPATTQQKIKLATEKYKTQVILYKNTTDKATKQATEKEIARLKEEFSQIANPTDKDVLEIKKLQAEIGQMPMLFSREEQEDWKKQVELKTMRLQKLEEAYNEKLTNLYRNAFEWRFEFPEVLNENGDFVGFDVVIGNPPYIRQEEFSTIKPFLKQRFSIYNSIADLLTYFVELSFDLLKEKGNFQFIISNKFTRANYGKEMRNFLRNKTQITHFIDFSGLPVFDEATVDAAVLGFCKNQINRASFIYANIDKKEFDSNDFKSYLNRITIDFLQNNLSENSWSFESREVAEIKVKVEKQGVQLKNWNISISRGILTGLNEAFVIDGKKKDEFIAQDPRSAEFLKPLLRGRDIQKWNADYQDLWLIYIPKGYTIKTMQSEEGTVAKEPMPRYGYKEFDEAWEFLESNFPVLCNYIEQFKYKAENRTDKGDYWWEQRACAYLNDFNKPKIIYPNMTKYLPFVLDLDEHYYTNQKCFIITATNLFYLTSFFNSNLFKFCFRDNFPELLGGTRELSKVFFDKIPVKQISEEDEKPFKQKVEQILSLKKSDPKADTGALESEIDRMVYALYELTPEEIAIVERGEQKK